MAKKLHAHAYTPPQPSERLRGLVSRIERLNEEVAVLKDDIKGIYSEAKSAGFDVKIVRQMVRERAMSEADLEEAIALAEIYRAALGMLNGTPLGDHARKRFEDSQKPPPPTEKGEPTAAPQGELKDSEIACADVDAAKLAGAIAQKAGVSIVKNPHPFGDPRRAAWDDGFCSSAGHDGMEVPDAWRRRPKKSDAEDKAA
jgi:uncharacterized protein (UPF0335 family)